MLCFQQQFNNKHIFGNSIWIFRILKYITFEYVYFDIPRFDMYDVWFNEDL